MNTHTRLAAGYMITAIRAFAGLTEEEAARFAKGHHGGNFFSVAKLLDNVRATWLTDSGNTRSTRSRTPFWPDPHLDLYDRQL